jgi:HPt (histidine-containing phosphotransfer) domain-containing protein
MPQPALWSLPEDLAELLRDDPECVHSILETFIEQIRLLLDPLEAAVHSGDTTQCAKVLHRLKGALLQAGAPNAGETCRAFELALPEESADARQIRLDALKPECHAVVKEVEAFLASECAQGARKDPLR